MLAEYGIDKRPDGELGSNGWAFGRNATPNGVGVALGNPHFPWVGANRFWQMHLTIPGRMDVMGAAIGSSPRVIENSRISIRPSQKCGTDRPTSAAVLPT